jgi:PAS domain S-box-containing protein
MDANELDQKNQALLDAFEFAGVGTWEWDIRSDRVKWNNSMTKLFGQEPSQLEMSAEESFSAIFVADIPEMRIRIDKAIHEHLPYFMDFRVNSREGSVRWLRSNGNPIYDGNGVAISIVGITFDNTERVGLEQRLVRALDERDALLSSEREARSAAEHAGYLKDEFLATLSHELRTPLNAVLGWAQILRLKTADAPDDIKRGLEAIERNARLQTLLIDDLLDISRIIAGKVRLDVALLHPVTAVEAAIETCLPTAKSKDVQVEKILVQDAGPIFADPSRLQQIVWNLLSNAVKFTPKGGKVKISLAVVDDSVVIEVVDSGIGIAPEFIAHVFERFRQADASTSRSHSGLGLGLAIVKQLVDLHGGTIVATSAGPDLGTTMTVSLPLACS